MGTAGRDFKRDDRHHPAHSRFCRLCACELAEFDAVDVFGDEGRRHYLQTKIRKYLYVLVTSEDALSKMVCSTCTKRLEGVHRFAMMAYRTQERLKVQLHESTDNTSPFEEEETADSKYAQDSNVKKAEDRGLLHSILTKGAIEILAEGEPLASSEAMLEGEKTHTSSTEEMEVKVDPMLFLQCGMDHSASEISDMSDSEETRSSRIYSPEWSLLTDKDAERKKEEEEEEEDEKRESDGTKKSQEEVNESISNAVTKPYECTICNRSFVSQIGLQNHLWSHLPKEKKLDGKPVLRSHQVYSSNGVLHTNGDNNSSGNFVCPICSKKISTKGNLKVHLETHRPKGKYGCDICGRIFKTQTNLFRHKEYHGGIQFPCNVCGRVYPTNSTLRAHSITHSDLRPHACPLCDKTFKRNQDLKFHINQHTGARPYQCPYCPKAFASSGNCFSHRKRMHPREVHRDRQRAADLMR